jgi:hypothetical protein
MIGTSVCNPLNFMKKNPQFGYLRSFCARSTHMGAIPQGFRRRFVRGRSRSTSANPVSRSELAISAPYNHRQRHPGSSSSTTTCSLQPAAD